MRIETLLQRIEAAQRELAIDALTKPAGKEPFDYGRVVGIYTGLEQAKEIVIGLFRDVEEHDKTL